MQEFCSCFNMAKNKKKKAKQITPMKKEKFKLSDEMKKFLYFAGGVSAINLILFIIGYNISDSIAQGVYFIIAVIIMTVGCGVLGSKKLKRGFELGGAAIVSMCFFITFVNIYNVADDTFNWSIKRMYNQAAAKISSSCDKIYATDITTLYVNWDAMKLFSVTSTGGSNYFYETNLSPAETSEYGTLYGEGLLVDSLSKNVDVMAIHPATISTLTDYEHLVELHYEDEVYVAPTFLMGSMKWNDDELLAVAEVKFSASSDQNYKIYRLGDTFFIQNSFMAFVTPYKNVSYSEDAKFEIRYEEFMKAFSEDYTLDETLSFGLSKTLEVNSGDIARISFYYEIYSSEEEGGLLMEVIYTDGTADVCYIREMYAESLVSAESKG